MSSFLELAPWLGAMVVLVGASAFFSASEAALFFLRPGDRRRLARGTRAQRTAARLLEEPDRLLSAVLFWNLVVNIVYFSISSLVSIRLERMEGFGSVFAVGFAVLSLLLIIFFSEMLPKSVAVTRAMDMARLVSPLLALAVRVLDPVIPALRAATLLSRRIIWPGFQLEKDLELADLERAIQISGNDESIIQQEQTVLRNIVHLADIRVDEWMRPRSQFTVFTSPVTAEALGGELPPGGYLLVSEPESREVDKALRLDSVEDLRRDPIDALARPVEYLPWRATVADAFQLMHDTTCEVVAVVNEFGESIGVLTIDDIVETVFSWAPSRSKRILDLNPVHQIEENLWAVAGMMSLRRLARRFHVDVPPSRSVTVAGFMQETLGRVIQPGDECACGPFRFRLVEAPGKDNLLIEFSLERPDEEVPT